MKQAILTDISICFLRFFFPPQQGEVLRPHIIFAYVLIFALRKIVNMQVSARYNGAWLNGLKHGGGKLCSADGRKSAVLAAAIASRGQ